MMAESYSIVAELKANVSNFVSGIKQATSEVEGMVKKNKSTFDSFTKVGLAATAGGTAVAVGLGGAIKIAADFESGMSKVQAISGASGDEMVKLSAKAREMGAKTKFSATEASEAFSYMAMAGWKTTDMLDGIGPVMDLAAASGEDLALTSDILTDGLTAFGLSAKDGGRFADVMASASNNANTNVAMLGESFKYVAPLAGAMGYSIEDTSLALGLMANAGIKGSQAGTSLKTMFTNLAKPTKAMQDAMDDLGISLTDSNGNMKSMDEVMQDLRGAFSGLDEAQQAQYAATLFGKEAMAGALSVVNASEDDYNKLSKAINNSEGAAEEMARIMQDNLNGQLTNLKSALEEVAISIGTALLPFVKKAAELAQMLADKFNSLDDKTKTIIAVIAALSAGFLLLTGGFLVLIGMIPAIVAGFSAFMTVVSVLGGALGALVSPIGIAVAAIVGIGAALVLAYKKVEWFRDAVDAAWSALKGIASRAFNAVKEAVLTAMDAIKEFVREKLDQILQFWSENGAQISAAAQNIWNGIKAFIGAVMPVIEAIVSGAWFAIKVVVMSVWENIKGVIDGALNVIMGLVKTFASLFTGDWQGMWDGVKQLFSGAVEFLWNLVQLMLWGKLLKGVALFAGTFKTAVTTMWTAIRGSFTTAINAVKQVFTAGFNAMKSSGQSIMSGIQKIISTVWTAIKNLFTMYINSLKTVWSNGFNAIRTTGTTVMNAIRTMISTVWNAIKAVFQTTINAIKNFVVSGFNLIRSTITSVMNGVRSFISSVWNGIKSTITNVVNSIKSAVSSGFSGVANAIRTKMAEAVKAVATKMTEMLGKVTGAAGKFLTAGKDLIRGLIKGISSMGKAAIGAITGVVDGVVNKAKSLLGIHSPSRVFKSIGEYTGEGFADGIVGMYRQVSTAAAGLADAAMIDAPVLTSDLADQANAINKQASSRMKTDFTNQINVNRQPAVINVHVGGRQIAQEIVTDISRLQNDDYALRRSMLGY